MLNALTYIVLTVGRIQATMVLPEKERLAAEEMRGLIVPPAVVPTLPTGLQAIRSSL